jgi:aryl-alcohol dehydrogenase-like predicted oxidoreductase
MRYRDLGATGLSVSVLGFGCGNVGGLLVRGSLEERHRAVARAIELGINYFDTAPSYGDGVSERHLGEALRAVRGDVYVGTKFRLEPTHMADVERAIAGSLEESLRRLGREQVDLFQLHNRVAGHTGGGAVGVDDLLARVVPALEGLRSQGKLRFFGITGLGESAALHRAIDSRTVATVQTCYNLVNPSAGLDVPPGFPGQDFGRLLRRAGEHRVGVIVIRVLAGGALSGVAARHPIAVPTVEPIATGPDYATDVERARMLASLVSDGHAENLVDASLRFAIGPESVSTVLLGYSSLEQLEGAAASVARGPLPPAAFHALPALWRTMTMAGRP